MASPELVDITTACSRLGYLSTIGVVIDVLPPYQTKGSSGCVTFTLKDCHFDQPSWYGGLKVKYFNDSIDALPPPQLNDVVLLRDIRVGCPTLSSMTQVSTRNTLANFGLSDPQIQWYAGRNCFSA